MDGKRSKIWHFFTKESENKAKCDLCHSLYSIKGGSTTNLNKHLKTNHHPSYDNLFSPALISVPAQLNQQPSTSTSVPAQSNEQPSTSTNEPLTNSQKNASRPSEGDLKDTITKRSQARQTDITAFTRKPIGNAKEKK